VLYAVGVLIFAVGLLASIALHEIGHMVPAKRFGVKVTQYMVGFGPTLWSRRRGDTEYGIKAIPLGGYIRMIGMVPPRADGSRSRWPRRMATAVEEFRAVSRAEVTAADEDRQFYRLTPGKKIIVMLGGPTMNLLIWAVLTVVLLSTLGQPHSEPTTTVNAVVQCVVPANSTAAQGTNCPANATKAPAYGVLKPGDEITSVNGAAIHAWSDAVSIIENSAGKPLTVGLIRNGAATTVTLTPVPNVKYVDGSTTQTKRAGYIGVESTLRSYFVRTDPAQVPGQLVNQVTQGLHAIGDYPSKIGNLFGTVFEGKPRDPTGAVGIVGIGRLSGDFAQSSRFDLQEKVFLLVSMLAGVNLLLFFVNLLPLLPLDGGHVAGAIVEATKRGFARLRARPRRHSAAALPASAAARTGAEPDVKTRPIYVDTAQMLPVMYGVASILIVITLLVVYADIVSPIRLAS
jgi:membrane-associated protease RseP (regulator of RpoE activity)